jgi:hypothetical protein
MHRGRRVGLLLLVILGAMTLVGASAPLNPLVVRSAQPSGAAPAECEQGLTTAPEPRVDLAELEAVPDMPAAPPVAPPRNELRSELELAQHAIAGDDRPAFDTHLARAKELVDAYPTGGDRTAAQDVLHVYDDIARVWTAQFEGPFFDESSGAYQVASAYPGYREAVKNDVLTDQTGRRFYPARETRQFLAAIAASRLPRLGIHVPTTTPRTTHPTPRPRPTEVVEEEPYVPLPAVHPRESHTRKSTTTTTTHSGGATSHTKSATSHKSGSTSHTTSTAHATPPHHTPSTTRTTTTTHAATSTPPPRRTKPATQIAEATRPPSTRPSTMPTKSSVRPAPVTSPAPPPHVTTTHAAPPPATTTHAPATTTHAPAPPPATATHAAPPPATTTHAPATTTHAPAPPPTATVASAPPSVSKPAPSSTTRSTSTAPTTTTPSDTATIAGTSTFTATSATDTIAPSTSTEPPALPTAPQPSRGRSIVLPAILILIGLGVLIVLFRASQ